MNNNLILLPLILLVLYSCTKSKMSTPPPPPPVGTALTDKKDIQYGSAADTAGKMVSLKLDIYYPSGATTANKYPTVVLIHGGGFSGGDKGGFEPECQSLSDSGFIAVSINYRLGWRKGVGNCNGDTADLNRAMYRALQDAHAALRFLVSKKDEYAIDANWIFIGGSSAGSNTALNTTYITQSIAVTAFPGLPSSLGPVNTSGNTLTNSFTIKGVCNMWGALKDTSLISNSNAVPQISFHGMQDHVVPYDYGRFQNCPNYITLCGSLSLHRQLTGYSKASVVHLSTTGGHGPTEFSVAFMMSNTACFFKRIIQGKTITSSVLYGVTNSCR